MSQTDPLPGAGHPTGSPQPLEITSGKTLNQFLPFIQRLTSKGIQGPPVPLDPYALSRPLIADYSRPPVLMSLALAVLRLYAAEARGRGRDAGQIVTEP